MRRAGILAAITVVAVLAVGCGSEQASKRPGRARPHGLSVEVATLLAGIPQHGETLGDRTAPVTLAYFGDLQCSFCGQFTLGALRPLIQRYVRSGRLRIEYRSLQTATRSPAVYRTQQLAALAAGRQNKLWNFIELFYHQQRRENSGYVTEHYLQGLAQQVSGLNLPAWTVARNDPKLTGMLSADAQAASGVGATGTPAFLIGDTGGTFQTFQPGTLTSVLPYAAATEQLLRADRRRRLGSPRADRA